LFKVDFVDVFRGLTVDRVLLGGFLVLSFLDLLQNRHVVEVAIDSFEDHRC
jgi:hypothetical protein